MHIGRLKFLFPRLPAIYATTQYLGTGRLMSYGSEVSAIYRRVATRVDKILKGARPAALTEEGFATFHLVRKLNTRREWGVKLPHAVFTHADRAID